MKVLVTGGAGFIGRRVCTEVLKAGHEVRAYDMLVPQVHGGSIDLMFEEGSLRPDVDLRVGDVRDPNGLRAALDGCTAVVHLAAEVGVGQSMYEPLRYVSTNVSGTTVLMEVLTETGSPQLESLVVASSMSIYGEGGDGLVPETQPPDPRSVYALTKYDQEQLCLLLGAAYEIPTVALRFFNVYGPGQALSNPYTGVMAIFAAQLLNGERPIVYEDGKQTRDFVHVDDVARAVVAALEKGAAVAGDVFNVGTGHKTSVCCLAQALAYALHVDVEPRITGNTRVGDIRHCVADISKAGLFLDWQPQVDLTDGLFRQALWLQKQKPPRDVPDAHAELAARHLLT